LQSDNGTAEKTLRQQFVNFGKKISKQWQLQIMAIPGFIYMLIFNFIPMLGIIMAFQNYTVLSSFETAGWVGLENFRVILNDKFFWQAVINTLGISFLKLAFGFVLPIILAVMIYELKDGIFKKIIQTISYTPHFLSWIILGGMLITWLSSNGMFNQLFSLIGIETYSTHLLDADKYWWIAALSEVWKEAGWGTILYLATMATIDPTLYEAAEIDGANRLQQIWHITIPMIRPVIALNFILTMSGLFNSNLDQTLVLMNGQNQPRAEVINSYVYRVGLSQGNFSYATAVGLGVSIISALLIISANVITKKLNDNKSVL